MDFFNFSAKWNSIGLEKTFNNSKPYFTQENIPINSKYDWENNKTIMDMNV